MRSFTFSWFSFPHFASYQISVFWWPTGGTSPAEWGSCDTLQVGNTEHQASCCGPNTGAVNAKLASLTVYLSQLDSIFLPLYLLQKSLNVGQSQLLGAVWPMYTHFSFQRFPGFYFSFQSSHILIHLTHLILWNINYFMLPIKYYLVETLCWCCMFDAVPMNVVTNVMLLHISKDERPGITPLVWPGKFSWLD